MQIQSCRSLLIALDGERVCVRVCVWHHGISPESLLFCTPPLSNHRQSDLRHKSAYDLIYFLIHSSKAKEKEKKTNNKNTNTIRHPSNRLWCNVPANNAATRDGDGESHNSLTNLRTHTHTHTQSAVGKASLGKVTSTMKHAAFHCWASLPCVTDVATAIWG